MRFSRRRANLWGGMGTKIFLLSWAVSLLTLSIFTLAIIPEQKRDLQDALRSKAQGISSSLEEVTAGAAISEDYSSVVDHCVQVLAGDEAIDYLVVTKNDGTSVIVERNGWRAEKLGEFWRPQEHKVSAGIQQVPVFHRRVFHFSRPFDYSAIQWGWIHVGLSLATYDHSVTTIYQRTGVIAVICIALSLLASVVYAKRQIQPILKLQAVVGEVAKGDLTARAVVSSQDEIANLAQAFNTMADSVLQRNQILESVRLAAQEFLTAPDPRLVIPGVLQRLGQDAQATGACAMEISPDRASAYRDCWKADGAPADRPGTCVEDWLACAGGHTAELNRGDVVTLPRQSAGKSDGPCAMSAILIPVFAGGEYFGYIGFGDGMRQREWSEAERDSFRAVAGMFGASIARQHAQDALIDAKETLERRVAERTQELQDQVHAKERALAELEEAQRRLMDMSRLSGMAEVATGVLHNVGNVLNSVNVSATVVAGKLEELRLGQLSTAIDMLESHQEDIYAFVHEDYKGQRVLPYLNRLAKSLGGDRQVALSELQQLQNHIGHIKTIVATQQNYAKVSGLIEDLDLADLVQDALQIMDPELERHEIRVEREFEKLPSISSDKHKILQILLNLFRNAKEAIKQSRTSPRLIRIRIRRGENGRVRIEVTDSGIGLGHEELTRIFAHGYTTKSNGHGFGLHSGALAAQQMSGSLRAESAGPGTGATFILELPLAEIPARSPVCS